MTKGLHYPRSFQFSLIHQKYLRKTKPERKSLRFKIWMHLWQLRFKSEVKYTIRQWVFQERAMADKLLPQASVMMSQAVKVSNLNQFLSGAPRLHQVFFQITWGSPTCSSSSTRSINKKFKRRIDYRRRRNTTWYHPPAPSIVLPTRNRNPL